MNRLTTAHITHEACEKIGGIGAVLEGMITSPVYQRAVGRSILVGPYYNHLEQAPEDRLGPGGRVLYSTIDQIDDAGLGPKLHPIEWAFNVAFIYGTRTLRTAEHDREAQAEILLIDVFNITRHRVDAFKGKLFETLGIESHRYEADWAFEEYVRLAEPAFYALLALLRTEELPCVLFAHEFMGLPTAFKAVLDGAGHFRSVFHAHECATARRLVEGHAGHDARFYNILSQAREMNLTVDDAFGSQADWFRHALIRQAHVCDGVIAVGDYTAQEMHFLGRHFDHHRIDVVCNGIPATETTWTQKQASRAMLQDYAAKVLGGLSGGGGGGGGGTGTKPDVLMTHVTRPVVSKGIWRDLQICHELDAHLSARGARGVLFIVTTAGGTRRPQDVRQMEAEYGWPREHRHGYPDLVGPEVELSAAVDAFNSQHSHVQAVLVNQFGWAADRLGTKCPPGMTFADLRRGTDIEFGLATYEPFGISPLEPLGAGALCLISTVCGCWNFVKHATAGKGTENVIAADYVTLERERSIPDLLGMTQHEREQVELRVAADVAMQIVQRLPWTDAARKAMLERGQSLVKRLGWDTVLEQTMLPMLRRVVADPSMAGGGGSKTSASASVKRLAARV